MHLLLYIGNIINVFHAYINVTRRSKLRSQSQEDECITKKNQNGTSNLNSLEEETELLRRKLEAEKARKRTRGPYRKSHVNYYPI
jgi:hypothetical protein